MKTKKVSIIFISSKKKFSQPSKKVFVTKKIPLFTLLQALIFHKSPTYSPNQVSLFLRLSSKTSLKPTLEYVEDKKIFLPIQTFLLFKS